jgi:hypothetical protein
LSRAAKNPVVKNAIGLSVQQKSPDHTGTEVKAFTRPSFSGTPKYKAISFAGKDLRWLMTVKASFTRPA